MNRIADPKTALAVFAHPDDIEFLSAGTLLLLKERGWEIHYMNLSGGDLGSLERNREETRAMRIRESKQSAAILGATFHDPVSHDLQITYTYEMIRSIASVVRLIKPDLILTHALNDYMADHENTARLTLSATFVRGMKIFETEPPRIEVGKDVVVYHAMPHGLRTPMRQRVRAGLYVDTASVQNMKRQALAAHQSQKDFLDVTQGMNAYLDTMDTFSRQVGALSSKYEYAEGWRRHLHLGFSGEDVDPLADALGDLCEIDRNYEDNLNHPI